MKINAGMAMDLIHDAVAKNGEYYVYPIDTEGSCKYVAKDGETPLCIVGHALRAVKVNFVIERSIDAGGAYNINGTIGGGVVVKQLLRVNPDLEITNHALLIFAAAQGAQDDGGTWGVALSAARRVSETLSILKTEEKVVAR
jgi:hypothetical protein